MEVDEGIRRAIAEYLQHHNLHDTLRTFSTEVRHAQASDRAKRQTITAGTLPRLLQSFVRSFDSGQKDEFFRLWSIYVPWDLLQRDGLPQRLEFYLQIHFAVFPYRRVAPAAGIPPEAAAHMSDFRKYLEGPGQSLAQTSEFLCVNMISGGVVGDVGATLPLPVLAGRITHYHSFQTRGTIRVSAPCLSESG